MFGGIVEAMGTVMAVDAGRIGVESRLDDVEVGDSVSISGVCLTVSKREPARFWFDVMPETLSRTSLATVRTGDAVNLERSLAVGDRIGGHLVSGHVDCVGTVTAVRDSGNARWVTVGCDDEALAMIVPKGSVAVDGISLTVVDVFETAFTVSLIPLTLATTTAGRWVAGSRVNLEVDMLARYVQAQLHRPDASADASASPRSVPPSSS